ncbi:hypothetical protein AAV94_00600 [Lampropedia cohaerens]|uniref:Tetratricopeptide repeat protein n=2 Tax=Lampropedia cohaerens TaxID=1610491 RepID=A0A0U1Q3H5_9BURK|nr:hypothetical protein AAV94_00600 [Lampropedia cohaerens]
MEEDLYEQIERLAEEGNAHLDGGRHAQALAAWRAALDLLPEDERLDGQAMWLHASMGEAYFLMENWPAAKDEFYDALNCSGGLDNPFVHYMLGKTLLRLSDSKGLDQLVQARMLDGDRIFEADKEEGAALLQLMRENGLA